MGGGESELPHLNSNGIEFPGASLWLRLWAAVWPILRVGVGRPHLTSVTRFTILHWTSPFLSPDLSLSTYKMMTLRGSNPLPTVIILYV